MSTLKRSTLKCDAQRARVEWYVDRTTGALKCSDERVMQQARELLKRLQEEPLPRLELRDCRCRVPSLRDGWWKEQT